MANAAAKKSAKAGKETSRKYILPMIASTILFLLWRLVWNYNTSIRGEYIYFIISLICHAVSYFGLVHSSENNMSGEYYNDLFIITVSSQIAYTFFSKGWMILLLVPGYGAYIGVGLISDYRKLSAATNKENTEGELQKTDSKSKQVQPRQKIKRVH
jgi:hypothetical protein